jgi:hypothetical protein
VNNQPPIPPRASGEARRPNNHQVNRAARHYVAAELHRRGAEDVLIGTKRADPDLRASNPSRAREVRLTVKAKTAGDWQVSTDSGVSREAEPDPTEFWILVDLRNPAPGYLVIPAWWIENNIFEEHQAYLARHGGQRARSPESKHHRITDDRVEQWRDKWDILRLFGDLTLTSVGDSSPSRCSRH